MSENDHKPDSEEESAVVEESTEAENAAPLDDPKSQSVDQSNPVTESQSEKKSTDQRLLHFVLYLKNRPLLLAIAALVLLSSSAAAAIIVSRAEPEPEPQPVEHIDVIENVKPETPDEHEEEILEEVELDIKVDLSNSNPISVASWIDPLQKGPYQEGVFTQVGQDFVDFNCCGMSKADDSIPKKEVGFTKAGQTKDGREIYIVSYETQGLGTNYNYGVFLKDSSTWQLLQHNSPGFFEGDQYVGYELGDSVEIVQSEYIAEFIVPETINIQGADIQSVSTWYLPNETSRLFAPNNLKGYTKLADTAYGTMYERVYEIKNVVGVKSYQLLLQQIPGTLVYYSFALSGLNDDNSIPISWNDNTKTTDQYSWTAIWRGCGSGGINALAVEYHKDLVARGTDHKGRTVYELKSASSPPFKNYNEYYNQTASNIEGKEIDLQAMYDQHGMIFIKNELGYYITLVNQKNAPLVECAKPVIYLYPEIPTTLHVDVGADVTKSDPQYRSGWDVTALPSGQLIVGGRWYDSLFWDGTGHGYYPEITSGFVVKQADVEATLWKHLAQLGLNETESADFMEYWLPLMPDTPYVRLTWLDTPVMSELAPLYLSKRPDTLIRVFLDFEGLDAQYDLPTQKLYSIPRRGFTVVEWGGLLVGGD